MAKYISNRQQKIKIGIASYTEDQTVLEVTGKVGIGTTNASADLDVDTVRIRGSLYDKDNQPGIVGQLLVSTNTGVDWQDVTSIQTINNIINTTLTGIGVEEEGVGIGTTFSSLNFIGTGVTASANGTTANITFTPQVGPQGVQGTTGIQGIQGRQGTTGSQGIQGITGIGILNWSTKVVGDNGYTASNRDALIADTSGGSFTINLPSSPTTGNYIVISDGANWETNNLIVGRNGSTIESAAEDLTLDIGGLYIDFVYDGSTWEVYPSVGQGVQGTSGFDGSTIPGISTTSSYVLSINDVGQHVAITTGGVTVPADVFSSGDAIMIINDSDAQQTITAGVGITMYFAGTSLTGTRYIQQRGLVNVLCYKPNVFTIVGAGMT